ncbi:unnamed protein product [Caenorhabditis auriculariae]|uniref:Apple domain-containing protein n=1 Tax=Caenorhabditis auriculariae TaxID=2777116 RepID=A0A8S1HIZ1_9PELO|nr:unnamed protein product [Caenorhabditis auriculariae]
MRTCPILISEIISGPALETNSSLCMTAGDYEVVVFNYQHFFNPLGRGEIELVTLWTVDSSDAQYSDINSEEDCRMLCEKKRGCWGFSYNTVCNLFNATTDSVKVDRGDSGDVIWLMINYNLTKCGPLEDIEMKAEAVSTMSRASNVYADDAVALKSPSKQKERHLHTRRLHVTAHCGQTPIERRLSYTLQIRKCDPFFDVESRNYAQRIFVWFIKGYSRPSLSFPRFLVKCEPQLWSTPYCQQYLTCGSSSPMFQWKMDVDGIRYSTTKKTNTSFKCGAICSSSTPCSKGMLLYRDKMYGDTVCLSENSPVFD